MNDEKEIYNLAYRHGLTETRALITIARKLINDALQLPGIMDEIEKKHYKAGGYTALDFMEKLIQSSIEKRFQENEA